MSLTKMHSQMDKINKYLLLFIYARYRTVPFSKPFFDEDLLNLMAQAPEDWGRGECNWNNIKYPLKKYTGSQIDFDDEILSSPGCDVHFMKILHIVMSTRIMNLCIVQLLAVSCLIVLNRR